MNYRNDPIIFESVFFAASYFQINFLRWFDPHHSI